MGEQHVSAALPSSLGWDDEAINRVTPEHPRDEIADESMLWQELSMEGADVEREAYPSGRSFSSRRIRNGVERPPATIPGRPPREPNRLLEIHGLMGAIGEQLGLAWAAEQDVQRIEATRDTRSPEHQRLIQRSVAENVGHFVLGATHSLGNLVLRLLLLNQAATDHLCEDRRLKKTTRQLRFPVGSDERDAWLTLNGIVLDVLRDAAEVSGNGAMKDAVEHVRSMYCGDAFQALDLRRGMDYHRRRPQSVAHVSPRSGVVGIVGQNMVIHMPVPRPEAEADERLVYEIVLDALVSLHGAMTAVRQCITNAIRGEGIDYYSLQMDVE